MLAADGKPGVILRIFLINDEKLLSLIFEVWHSPDCTGISLRLALTTHETPLIRQWFGLDSAQGLQGRDGLVLQDTGLLALGQPRACQW